jgi:hypothetical protein
VCGQLAADRGREPAALSGRLELRHRLASGERRVGKIRGYQSLARIRRQSRDNLSASSGAYLAQRICAAGSCPRHQAAKATEANSDLR